MRRLATVIAFDVSDDRNKLALAIGADEAHNPLTLHAEGTSPAEQMRRESLAHNAEEPHFAGLKSARVKVVVRNLRHLGCRKMACTRSDFA